MKLTEKHKIALAGLAFALLAAGGGAMAFFKFQERQALFEDIGRLEQREARARTRIRKIPELRTTRNRLASLIEEYATILPKEHHVQQDAFMEIMDGFRKDARIFIKSAEPVVSKVRPNPRKKNAPARKEDFIQHKYQFELIGSFKDFLKFLHQIETHDRFLDVDEFEVKPIEVDRKAGGGSKSDITDEIERAKIPLKSIRLVVSTYTYSKEKERGGASGSEGS